MEIVLCSAPTMPGQSPPTLIFTPFSKLSNCLAGNKVKGGRVGFVVHPSVVNLVDSHEILSPLTILRLRLMHQNHHYHHLLFSNSAADDAELGAFNEDLEEVIRKENPFLKFVVDDLRKSEEGKHRIGIFGSGLRNEIQFCWALNRRATFSWLHHLDEERSPVVDMGVTQRYESCGDRPHSHQPRVVLIGRSVIPSFSSGSDRRLLRAKVQFSQKLEKKFCHRFGGMREVVYDGIRLKDLCLAQEKGTTFESCQGSAKEEKNIEAKFGCITSRATIWKKHKEGGV
ncbi:unnamed protein product [Strongylus vulgaris]|uniref:Uncharacterized protein n=1 Tax=Strongylus vulgaris TaxID=40348 RepID=A0A3P7KZ88_STRVU|nr:unnamed protein product [Strongylus vulgaris]